MPPTTEPHSNKKMSGNYKSLLLPLSQFQLNPCPCPPPRFELCPYPWDSQTVPLCMSQTPNVSIHVPNLVRVHVPNFDLVPNLSLSSCKSHLRLPRQKGGRPLNPLFYFLLHLKIRSFCNFQTSLELKYFEISYLAIYTLDW